MAFTNDAIEALRKTQSQAKKAFLRAFDGGATKTELVELNLLVTASGDAYWRAVASTLEDNNAIVKAIKADLDHANDAVGALLTNLQNVADLIRAITQAVRLAAALVTLAAAV